MLNAGSKEQLRANGRQLWWSVQILVVADNFLRMLHFTSNMTEAFSLAKDLGQDAKWSGLLISSAWGLAAIGSLIGWRITKCDQYYVSLVVTLAPWWSVLTTAMYTLGASPPFAWVSNDVRTGLLLTSRFTYGLMASMEGVMLNIVGARVTPTSGMVQFELYKQCARTLGIGGGPLLSSLCSSFARQLGDDSVRVRSALPGVVMIALWMFFAFAVWMLFPVNSPAIDELLKAKAQKDAVDTPVVHTNGPAGVVNERVAWRSASGRLQLRVLDAKRCVVVMGSFYGVERAFIVAALESATSFILETEFKFSTIDTGLAIGCTFLAALPVVVLLQMLKSSGGQRRKDNKWLLNACGKLSCISSVALFIGVSPMILISCALLFSTSYLASSITDGVALSHTVPGTLLCVENYMLADQVVQNTVARLLGPIVARALIDGPGGRYAYALFQFLFTVSGLGVCWAIKFCDHVVKDFYQSPRTSLQETGPELAVVARKLERT